MKLKEYNNVMVLSEIYNARNSMEYAVGINCDIDQDDFLEILKKLNDMLTILERKIDVEGD